MNLEVRPWHHDVWPDGHDYMVRGDHLDEVVDQHVSRHTNCVSIDAHEWEYTGDIPLMKGDVRTLCNTSPSLVVVIPSVTSQHQDG